MALNALNQNTQNLQFSLNSFMTSMLGSNFRNKSNSNNYYAKKGEPLYQKEMDSDEDGVVSFDEFRNYCKENGITAKEMSKMMEMRLAYQMTTDKENKKEETQKAVFGELDLIYAKDGDDKFDESMDTNNDSKISYREYLRYCEQNAKPEEKISDTKIRENNKNKFMTVSYGKISNAYNKVEFEAPEGKIENRA